jgi:S-DNA-T family DNA segregation ATPase FtsK/SpoIIIE
MATTVRKRQSGRVKSGDPLVSRQRKREVLGLILMVIAVLVALAVLTYHADDDVIASRFSLDSVLDPADEDVANALGPTGAVLAGALVPGFLGYCVVLLPVILFGWGWVWFRNRTPVYLPLVSGLLTLAAVFLATFFGWFAVVGDSDLLVWSGAWGLGLAQWLVKLLGSVGSFALLLLSIAVTALLLVDRDIQRSLDRVETDFRRLGAAIASGVRGWRTRRAERRELVARVRSERLRAEQQTAPRTTEPPVTRVPEADRTSPPPPRSAAPGTPDLTVNVVEPVREARADHVPRRPVIESDFEYEMPSLDLLDEDEGARARVDHHEIEENKRILLDKLSTYNIEITAIDAIVGPTVTLYELTPAPGVKISRITALEHDLAMAMAARALRMIAPIPGKTAIGVEIPNRHRELVRIRDVIGTQRFRDAHMELPLILGKSIEGEVVLQDLTKLPHVLIAGATGSGKSVGLNTFIAGMLYACPPSHVKFVMIDPKKIELAAYARLEAHYLAMPPEADAAIITDFGQALGTLKSCEIEMDTRYDLLSDARVRSVREYNDRFDAGQLDRDEGHRRLPYIVVVVDELADLMMTAGKDIEAPIARLAQKARAVGLHLILATQRPSVDVITGLIKANFPSRIALQVASKIDSRTILDQNGAEGLVGNGDMLYMHGSRITRLQGPFVSIEEIERVTEFIGNQEGPGPYLLPSLEDGAGVGTDSGSSSERDDLFEEAARIIVRSQQGSVSLLQRKLSVGYSRAARIVDQLEDAGIVGPFEGSKARQVRVADETELDNLLAAD